MQTNIQLTANEIDSEFLKIVKSLFKDRIINITIADEDETFYLTKSKAIGCILKMLLTVRKRFDLLTVSLGKFRMLCLKIQNWKTE